MTNWEQRMLQLAALVAGWSKDPSTRVGCVIATTGLARPLAVGFNGFARGADDSIVATVSREERLLRTIHAEANAVAAAAAEGVRLSGATAFVTHHPCASCALLLAQAGVCRAYCPPPEPAFRTRWAEQIRVARETLLIIEIEP